MTCCWVAEPENRPTFSQLLDCLYDFSNALGRYIWAQSLTWDSVQWIEQKTQWQNNSSGAPGDYVRGDVLNLLWHRFAPLLVLLEVMMKAFVQGNQTVCTYYRYTFFVTCIMCFYLDTIHSPSLCSSYWLFRIQEPQTFTVLNWCIFLKFGYVLAFNYWPTYKYL